MQDFFDNMITVHASSRDLLNILANPKFLTQWDREVARLDSESENRYFTIVRTQDAINTTERLTINQIDDTIIYDIQGDRLSYQVQFTADSTRNITVLTERVLLNEHNLMHLPLPLLRPIAKHAFMENLRVLATLTENWSGDIEARL